jgi:RecB family endonuclease NucS
MMLKMKPPITLPVDSHEYTKGMKLVSYLSEKTTTNNVNKNPDMMQNGVKMMNEL